MIRKATPADIPAIVELGIEVLNERAYQNVLISRPKIEAVAKHCVSSAQDFAWVAENDGKVVGAIIVIVHECMFYERHQATVALLYSRHPVEEEQLLDAFLNWAHGRPAIKVIKFEPEYETSPPVGELLIARGLQPASPSYIELL